MSAARTRPTTAALEPPSLASAHFFLANYATVRQGPYAATEAETAQALVNEEDLNEVGVFLVSDMV